MRTTIPKRAPVLLLASVLMIGASASAEVIYSNTNSDSRLRFGPTNQFGDEIILAGTARTLTAFSFEYWALNGGTVSPGLSLTAAVQVRFYINDGSPDPNNGYARPGTLFYDSGPFLIGPSGATDRSTVNYTPADFLSAGWSGFIPTNHFTWTVQFSGLDGNDTAGLDVFYPPTVGTSPAQENNQLDDYWEFSGGSWALKTNSVGGVGVDMSFGARFDAVPEPSTAVFGVLGGLGLLFFGRRFVKVSK